MKQVPLLQGKAMIVEMPEGAKDPFVAKTYIDEDGHTYDTDPQWIEWSGAYPNSTIDLPPGNWRIIGMLSEVTEEQVAGIVAKHYSSLGYDDYLHDVDFSVLDTALESLESAILTEGRYFENPHGAKRPSINDYSSLVQYQGDAKDFDEAQSRVLDRSRCLLLGREDL